MGGSRGPRPSLNLQSDHQDLAGGVVVPVAWRERKEVRLEGTAIVWVFDVPEFTEPFVDEVPRATDPNDRQDTWARGAVLMLFGQLKPARNDGRNAFAHRGVGKGNKLPRIAPQQDENGKPQRSGQGRERERAA